MTLLSRVPQSRLGWLLGILIAGAPGIAYVASRLGAAPEAEHPRQDPLLESAAGQPGVGSPLPELLLLDHEGRALTSAALRGQPVWLAFFRGADCPFCRRQLQDLGSRAAEIARAGVQLLGISPDPPETSARLRRELGLSFPLLSDPGERAVTALCRGLAHCQLLVDARGIVRWAGLSESWTELPPPEALLSAARSLRDE